MRTKRLKIVDDEITILEPVRKGKPAGRKQDRYEYKWCPYNKHWCSDRNFTALATYCRKCMNTYNKRKYYRPETVERLEREVAAITELLLIVFACDKCASKGYVINHENKVFACGCRAIAKQQVDALTSRKAPDK